MKLSKKRRESMMKTREVEHYYNESYGGVDFVIRSNVAIDRDLYRILDAAYPFVMMGATNLFIENRIIESFRFWSKIKAVKVDVKGRECEIRLSSDPREFIGW